MPLKIYLIYIYVIYPHASNIYLKYISRIYYIEVQLDIYMVYMRYISVEYLPDIRSIHHAIDFKYIRDIFQVYLYRQFYVSKVSGPHIFFRYFLNLFHSNIPWVSELHTSKISYIYLKYIQEIFYILFIEFFLVCTRYTYI